MSIIPGLFPSPQEAMDMYNEASKKAQAAKDAAYEQYLKNMEAVQDAINNPPKSDNELWHMNSRGEMIPMDDYKPGSYGYGQDYTDAKGPIENWLDYLQNQDPEKVSPGGTVEAVGDAIGGVGDAVGGIGDTLAGINWPVVAVAAGAGILILAVAAGAGSGISSGIAQRLAK